MRRTLVAVVVALCLLPTACSHTVVIDSDPSGAEIKINGEKLGKTPVTYTETTGWEKVYEVEATAPGYKTTRRTLKQTDWNMPVTVLSAGPAVLTGFTLGLPCLIGLFWARQLPDRVVVVMDKQAGAAVPDGTAPPPSSYGY